MDTSLKWLEAHDALSGWAQFFGAMLALLLTYFTAFAPVWRRRKQLAEAAKRLLANGYEAVESYHRTSQHVIPNPLSIRLAIMTFRGVSEEIDRFPIYELDDQGSRSTARHLLATNATLKGLALVLESSATELEDREGTKDDQSAIEAFVGERVQFLLAMLSGQELKRPDWTAVTDPVG